MSQAIEKLKALSDLNRLRIVMALRRFDELCACQITELLQVTGATASRHLSVLQHAEILASRKEGRWIHYRLAPAVGSEALLEWVEATCAGTEPFKADGEAMKRIASIDREDLCRMQRGVECCPG
jgi:ArsR family transcriptional regulator